MGREEGGVSKALGGGGEEELETMKPFIFMPSSVYRHCFF